MSLSDRTAFASYEAAGEGLVAELDVGLATVADQLLQQSAKTVCPQFAGVLSD